MMFMKLKNMVYHFKSYFSFEFKSIMTWNFIHLSLNYSYDGVVIHGRYRLNK